MEILLNPGPVNLSERVRRALLKPDLCHRETEFSLLQQAIRDKLLAIYALSGQEWAAVLMTGSGTSAMESMLSSLVPADGKVLVIENGVYGERLTRIAAIHNIAHTRLHYDWGAAIQPQALAAALANEPGISHVAVVQHETTTGRLNDIARIAEICTARDVGLLVDGVSSFGAEAISFADWNINACAATANKCLHSIPGTSFVIVRRASLQQENLVQRSLYLDLNTYLAAQDNGGTPFTQSVQSFYALDEALSEHADEGGWTRRRQAYRSKMDLVRNGLMAYGIKPLLEPDLCSCVLNAFLLPPGMDYTTLHDGLKQQGFVIYAGQGDFARQLFRISVMGTSTLDDMQRFLQAVRSLL
jgi:2-aminoethylphosphonate-pyruvate transaminase